MEKYHAGEKTYPGTYAPDDRKNIKQQQCLIAEADQYTNSSYSMIDYLLLDVIDLPGLPGILPGPVPGEQKIQFSQPGSNELHYAGHLPGW